MGSLMVVVAQPAAAANSYPSYVSGNDLHEALLKVVWRMRGIYNRCC
jgi:hypothetical protein